MLLAANSQRQLGHTRKRRRSIARSFAKYPNRDEAKDAQYQRLINLYNANDPKLREQIDEFLSNNPNGERADQAKLLKAEALYKEKDFAAAATLYADLRDSNLVAQTARRSRFQTGLVSGADQGTRKADRCLQLISYRVFPDNPQVPSALAQRALAYQETKNYELARSDLEQLLIELSKSARNVKPRFNKKR